MNAAVIAFTRRGAETGRRIAGFLGAELTLPARLAPQFGAEPSPGLAEWTAREWHRREALVFVGACGIAVRAVAPHVRDKFSDPAVVAVDEAGGFAVPLLSGHWGGANELAVSLAELLGGRAAVSTATDVNGLFAVDVWAKKRGLALSDRELARAVSAAVLEGTDVALTGDFPLTGCPPAGVSASGAGIKVYITYKTAPEEALRLIPRCLDLGIGCRRGTPCAEIGRAVRQVLAENGADRRAIASVRSIDLKRDEPGLAEFCRGLGVPFITYSAAELMRAPGEFAPSEFVRAVTGADNVCERAAALSGGRMLIGKTACGGVTVAAALRDMRFEY